MDVAIEVGSFRARIAASLVVLLFPGFYLYNSGLANAWFPQFLGGWFGPVAAVIGLPFLAYLAADFVRCRARFTDHVSVFVSILVVYCFVWASIYTLFSPVNDYASHLYFYTVEALLLWSVTFVAFKYFNYSSKRLILIIFALWLCMFVIAVIGQQGGMYYAAADVGADSALRISSYQGFARSALIAATLILIHLRGWKLVLFGLCAFVLLFLLGARTEFVGIVLIILISVLFGRGRWLAKAAVLVIAIMVIMALSSEYSSLVDQSRIDNLLHLGQDTSWQARQGLQSGAEATIREHWLFGAYGSEVQHGEIGSYAHNALSAWVSFGLFGFLLFVGLNLTCLGYMMRAAARVGLRTTGAIQFALGMSIYAVVCMIFAKNVADPIFAVSWGATAAVAARGRIRTVDKRRAEHLSGNVEMRSRFDATGSDLS